jgi:mannose-1-phosphate guanylyltransferase
MILAGGMSTRLYPLTRAVPKPLVPVAGEPITAHVIRWLASFGYNEIAINVHYLADQIKARFGDGSGLGVKLHYLDEVQLMGSAGALKPLESFFTEPFVVVGCDDLSDANLDTLVAFHQKHHALATIGLVEAEEVDQYGVVITDSDGRIVDFQEKPPKGTERSHSVNTGIYVFDPEIFAHIPANTFYDFGKQVFPSLQAANAAFYGMRLVGAYWCDIGTPREYTRATADVLAGRVAMRGTRQRGIAGDVRLGDDIHIDGDVRIGSGAVLGKRIRIAGPSVVGDGVRVGDDAVLERTIVWEGASIGARARLADSIVGVGYEVPADARLVDVIVANEPVAAPKTLGIAT